MLGVYIHIPFCNKICHYCDFCKILYNEKYIDTYLDNLYKEIKSRYKGETIKTIYIGGGTPSSLTTNELDKLLSIISVFKLDTNYEYTIECNVENINIDFINIIKSYGINRVSVGVETFDKKNAHILGRCDNEDLIFDNIYMLKKYFDNINIDLIYGVNNDINVVKKDISKFLELDVPHVSCYSLIIEEHTKLYIDKHKYIDEETDYKMYEYICNTLTKNGYNHYEISNYAKSGYESIHNKNYWLNGSYYGFGLGAVSYLNNTRINNTKNLTKYLSGNYLSNSNYEDLKVRKENTLMLGLRLIDGISIDSYNKEYHEDLLSKKIIEELINDEYLEVSGDMLKVNAKYLYTENEIIIRLLDNL